MKGIEHHQPFNHGLMDNVVNKSLLSRMQRHFPAHEALSQTCKSEPGRHHTFLEMDSQSTSSPARQFWLDILEDFHVNKSALKKWLITSQAHRLPPIITSEEFLSLGVRLVSESLPFTLRPHIDRPQKAAVAIFYINSPEQSGGTALYEKVGNAFEVRKKLPFMPGSGLFMNRVHASWHGGDWQGHGFRQTLHLYFFAHPAHQKKAIRQRYTHLF